ncbi:MAG: tetratricopeptide repeat protein [Leptolyngbyaceae cyanobacterium bins.349]|nr:tetratricopeptide repeat protein [Leptolyngbyaceae cyanobacterium bins.349]
MLNLLAWVTPVLAADASTSPPSTTLAQPSAADLFEKLDGLYQKALEATNKQDFAAAETYWTQMLDVFPQNPAVWSNRGNSRVSQNKLEGAIADFNKSIELAPDAPDPYLNRGAALEGLGKWQEAIADYNHVLELDPQDPAAYNNRGNAKTGLGQWEAAIADFKQAADLAPDYAFARANEALALYQIGETDKAMRMMRNLVRKYPQFADMRAALTAALWVNGKQGEAESEWVAAVGVDSRYKNIDWLKNTRRWPPSLIAAMEKFLTLKS